MIWFKRSELSSLVLQQHQFPITPSLLLLSIIIAVQMVMHTA